MAYPKIPSELNVVMESAGELGTQCKWALNMTAEQRAACPHTAEDRTQARIDGNSKVKDSILDCVGNTPLVRCQNLAAAHGIKCNLLAKCEFLNPGGAVKDRIGRRMVVDAEKTGKWDGEKFAKGDVIIEPTSGNTGIGLSMASAVKGYDMIITMPEKMSQEKQDALKGLGATIVRTPTEYAWDHEGSHISEAYKLRKKLNEDFAKEGKGQHAHVLDQYRNPGNGMAHYDETGQEIWDQTEASGLKVDFLVAGAGTGGTITGIARKLKEKNPDVKIIGVDPNGSILAQDPGKRERDANWSKGGYQKHDINKNNPAGPWGQQTEGIGYDFIPRVCDRNVVDIWMKGPDKESFVMARELMAKEGFMCGGSSGTSMYAAIKFITENPKFNTPEHTVVVVLPDNIRNYMTKHLNADWMYERSFMSEDACAEVNKAKYIEDRSWGQNFCVRDLVMNPAVFMRTTDTCEYAINQMRSKGFDQFPVKDEKGDVYGVVTANGLLTRLGKGQLVPDDPIKRACVRDLRHVSLGVKLNELVRILGRNSFVLVDNKFFITFSDIFDLMVKKPEWVMTKEEFERNQAATTRNIVVAGFVAFAAGALLSKFGWGSR